MKLAIIGYGKMGKTIERIALHRGHSIILTIDLNNSKDLHSLVLTDADCAIEFSQPEAAYDNIVNCFKASIPVVSGTTGWIDRMAPLEATCKKLDGGLFYSSNFSIGMNLFFRVNDYLAELLGERKEYDVRIDEIHHKQKKDAPSGTAITLTETILRKNSRYNHWKLYQSDHPGDLIIHSVREGIVPGTHTVQYVSDIDKISIRHEAFNRDGFATGAVLAAEFMQGRKGIYGMNDLLHF